MSRVRYGATCDAARQKMQGAEPNFAPLRIGLELYTGNERALALTGDTGRSERNDGAEAAT